MTLRALSRREGLTWYNECVDDGENNIGPGMPVSSNTLGSISRLSGRGIRYGLVTDICECYGCDHNNLIPVSSHVS